MPPPVTLVEALAAALARLRSEIRVALPARVVAVDAATGRVRLRVQSRVPRPLRDGGHALDDLPDLPDVPVATPRTSSAELVLEVAVGDPGLVVFADVALGGWLATGEVGDPPALVAHGPSGAVFYPGLAPDDEAEPAPSGGVRARLAARGGARVEVLDGEVRVYSSGSAVELARKTDAEALNARITSLESQINVALAILDGNVGVYNALVPAPHPAPMINVTTVSSSATIEGTTVLKGE